MGVFDDAAPPSITATERVDQTAAAASLALARWLALPLERRRAIVRRFATEMRDRVATRHDSVVDLLEATPKVGSSITTAADRVLAMLERDDDLTSIGFRPGICAVIHGSNERPTAFLACAIMAALLSDSVVVVATNAMSKLSLLAGAAAANDTALPIGVVSWFHADEETTDALVSSPLVSTLAVEHTSSEVERLRSLAAVFGKPVILYSEHDAFR